MTKSDFKRHDIHNQYNLVKRGDVFISYRADSTRQRGGIGAAWQVVRSGYKTAGEEGHWTDHGNKTFGVYGSTSRESALYVAMQWCKTRYGITDWFRTPFGAWMSKGRYDKITGELKERK